MRETHMKVFWYLTLVAFSLRVQCILKQGRGAKKSTNTCDQDAEIVSSVDLDARLWQAPMATAISVPAGIIMEVKR